MANIQDYIDWRGDVPLSVSPFNKIDALILCQLTYLKFDGLLPGDDFGNMVTMQKIAEIFKNSSDFKKRSETGVLINAKTVPFLQSVASSERFREVLMTGYSSKIDLADEEQFAAATFILPDKTIFIAFRGTDDNIVGWKEDFNLATENEVPAQRDAVLYMEKCASCISGKIRVGGHSKGGNLAIYASAMVPKKIEKRIIEIYNNDGPGFYKDRIESPQFKNIIPKISSYYPQFSIVGMMFNHAGKKTFVESDEVGIMQHDPFSWHIKGKEFVCLKENNHASRFFYETFNAWVNGMDSAQKEIFIETVFEIIEATDATTNSEIEANLLKNSLKIIRAISQLEPEMRRVCEKTVIEFFKIGHSKLPEVDKVIRKILDLLDNVPKDMLEKARKKIGDSVEHKKEKLVTAKNKLIERK